MKHSAVRSIGIFFLTVGLLILILCTPSANFAKELPILVNLSEIDASFDGLRVTIFGWARSAEVKTGRRGSLHLQVIVGDGKHKIMVFSIHPVHNIIDREVIVQGIYHEHGRFAGFEQNRFIVAEAIERNWEKEEENR